MSTTEPTTEVGRQAVRYARLEAITTSRYGAERQRRIEHVLAELVTKAERESAGAALSQFTPERIQRELDKHRMTSADEQCPCGVANDHLAAALAAALTEKPQETR